MGLISDIGTGLSRAAYSLGISFGQPRRDAGRSDLPEMNGWNPPPGFAGSNSYGERDAILGRARDLDKNNAWINGGLDRRVESVIGGSIRLAAQPELTILNRDYDWPVSYTHLTLPTIYSV